MAFELDHVFIFSSVGGGEAAALLSLGLTEGTPNTHPGQGTACRRFFFHNVYLELLWIQNETEAQSERTRQTHFWERWSGRNKGTCPFGLVFRPVSRDVSTPPPAPPFDAWEYRPGYLPEGMAFRVGANAGRLMEPFLCALPFHQRPDEAIGERCQPLEHALDVHEITRIELHGPWAKTAPTWQTTAEIGRHLQRREALKFHIQLGFDGESKGHRADLRPTLPLAVCW